MIGRLYEHIWFYTEFWIAKKVQRRPFTFIMRDWLYPNMGSFIVIIICWYIGVAILALVAPLIALLLGILSSLLLAHLVWGSKYIKDEQEYPTFIDE